MDRPLAAVRTVDGGAGEDAPLLVAAPDDALATTLAHTILETDQIRLSDLRIVRWSIARGPPGTGIIAPGTENIS